MEPEWICPDGKKCKIIKSFCGNGKYEKTYGETCDDGNIINGDGCSSICKIENGWSFKIYSLIENKSYCNRQVNSDSFCGNGVVEGNEECDDGFPLKNNDGCSTGCRTEQGWTCGNIVNSQISKCQKI